MKKYFIIIKTEIQRQLTYRIEIYAYRVGNLLEIVALLALWLIAYDGTHAISGYSQNEMVTYVIVGWLFVFLSRTYGLENRVADDIFEGRVSDYLVKPVSYLKYMTALSIGRTSIAILSAIILQSALMFTFSKYMVFSFDFLRFLLLLLILVAAYFINIFISLLMGMIAFWTHKITGIDYTLNTIIKFLAGAYFPIALLPESFLKFDKLFPFIYTVYVPANLYLGKISIAEGFFSFLVEIIWICLLYAIIKIIWNRGARKYEGVGI